MFTKLLNIAVLTIACTLTASAAEECQFNEYSSRKVVSDYSSVIVEVSSLQGCLSYLKRNKFTHKAVAYQASSGKCCSVLQDLEYSLKEEPGWTTFEVRQDGPVLIADILGLCPGRAITLNKDQSVTLSVNSYNYSVCVLESLNNYVNGPDCLGSVATASPDLNLEFSLSYSTERSWDIIRLRSAYQDFSYSGVSNASGILHGPLIFVSWTTDSSVSGKGFCLTVTATTKPPTGNTTPAPTVPTTRITTTRTPPNGTEVSRGVCDFNSTYIPGNSTATFSVYSEYVDPCVYLSTLSPYASNMNCNHNVATDAGFQLQYYLITNTERNYDYVTLSYGNNGESVRYTGSITADDIIDYNAMIVNWRSDTSDINGPYRGFCLKVSSVPDVERTNFSVIGVCNVQNILVVQNYTRSVSVYSYDFEECSDLSLLRSYATNQFCLSRLYVANNESDFEYEITYQTQNVTDFLSIYNNVNELRFFGNGTSRGVIEGPILQLQWSTDNTVSGKGFCLKIRATTPIAEEDKVIDAEVI